MTDKLLLTIDEVAEQMSLIPTRVEALILNGTLPAIKVGRRWRIPSEALRAWVAEQLEQQRSLRTSA